MRNNSVKAALKEGRAQVGTWLSLASPIAARYMARTGFHWLTLDIEHSPVNWESASLIFGAIADAGGVPLARVPGITVENVKRCLDAGAYGIVFPMCNSVEEAELAVAACKYPPNGQRSVGGGFHALNFGASPAEYYRRANDEILVVIQAEHVLAVERADQILAVPGIDAVFVGPNDLLSSMAKTPAMDSDDPAFVDALRHVRETAVKHGVAPGLHTASAAVANQRIAEGWQFVAISSELGFMLHSAADTVSTTIGQQHTAAARY
ncbi:HpcH/HpaI aldolase family protein [Fimbriimonas ginsengisoli]|uniref:2-dehydro-3-deoxyglucarate aldolase n=1 Tax=Fimbriimonas ginsengisoli Gsoil 348 TaxID=661478 RepID=A0A068NRM2_FIMGI|nr:aldolase/citrate lyase family protein [Fimbriimonas ginsengisoli]AIE86012.1 2-dehydro-3-deoxyglucarate aldolase [Fimbriimonas ginsengisoli Gsoil 348]